MRSIATQRSLPKQRYESPALVVTPRCSSTASMEYAYSTFYKAVITPTGRGGYSVLGLGEFAGPPAKVEVPPHLRLGLNYKAYERFIKEELCKVDYNGEFRKAPEDAISAWVNVAPLWSDMPADQVKAFRSKYPPDLSWIAEQYGDRLTGYDLAEATKMWLRMNNAEDKSVCCLLYTSPSPRD